MDPPRVAATLAKYPAVNAAAMAGGRPHRASGELVYRVLDMIHGLHNAPERRHPVLIT